MDEGLVCTSLASPLGPLVVAVSEAGVCCVAFEGDVTASVPRWVARSGTAVTEDSEPPAQVAAQFADYFAGKRKGFTLPLDYRFVTPFQRLVFDVLLQVPPGQVVTYGELARAIGRPEASRGVGSAMAHNPLPILVPCHRVIRRDGTLAGYAAGVRIKEYLLALEGVMLPIRGYSPKPSPRAEEG